MYSFKNEIHSSCFNLREKITKHNTRGVKKILSANTPGSALRERQCYLSLVASCAASYVRMRTTVKHHAAGTVKRTVPYKDFCIFFVNSGMATDIKLKDYNKYKERIKEKRTHYIICYR
jgi:hypothetical protein